MIRLACFTLIAVSCACDRTSSPKPTPARASAPAYTPETFRENITTLIAEKDYSRAVTFLRVADLDRQLAHDRTGYLGIGGDKVYLPSLGDSLEYDPSRDWYVPGTSDAFTIDDANWQKAATEFADRYNRRRANDAK